MIDAAGKLVIYGITVALLGTSMLFAAVTACNLAISRQMTPAHIYTFRR